MIFLLIIISILFCTLVFAGRFGKVSVQAGNYEHFYFRLDPGEPVIHVEKGETVKFKLYITRGDMDDVLHDVIVAGDDDRFDVKINPTPIPTIRNVDAIILYCTLTPKENVEEGVYPLKVKVKAKEFIEEIYPLDAKIKVGKHSNIPRLGLLLITFMLVGLLIWRQKTRK
jgi:uncharacterized membrane protein